MEKLSFDEILDEFVGERQTLDTCTRLKCCPHSGYPLQILDELIKQSGQTLPRLAELSGVPQKTIESWHEGRVRHPRDWHQVLYVAKAMRLRVEEVDRLLTSAEHKPVAELLAEARINRNKAMLELLAFWAEESDRRSSAAQQRERLFLSVPPLVKVVGRTVESEKITKTAKVSGCICTIYGMPGVGKTALAIKAAHELRSHFPDGVLWAQLNKSDTMSILYAFADAYGSNVSESRDIITRSAVVRNILRAKRALLILDNAERTEEITSLLPSEGSGCTIIITTRNHSILENKGTYIELAPFDLENSVALFIEHIGEARTAEERSTIEQIIALVGGLPLALQIIASDLADISALTTQEYYEGLQDEQIRLETLTDYDDANKDVRTSFEVSFRRLPASVQQLFSCLAVLRGKDFSIEAVAQISQQPMLHVRKGLDHLHNLSLIEAGAETGMIKQPAGLSLSRFRLHPLLALFATEKAGAQLSVYQQRAVTYYASFAQIHQDHFQQLAMEWENMVATLPWALEQHQYETFLRAVGALTAIKLGVVGFWDAQGHWAEALYWLEQALVPLVAPIDALQLAFLYFKTGVFALRLTDYVKAEQLLEKALSAFDNTPEKEEVIIGASYVYHLDFVQNEPISKWHLQNRLGSNRYLQNRGCSIQPKCG